MTLHPTERIDDDTWTALRQHFSEGEIVELVCAAGIFNYFNRINNFLDIEITR